MNKFAAGIIPFVKYKNKNFFLLGLEKSNNKWSGFVGNCENNETPLNTAVREFNEETAMLFLNYDIHSIIKNKNYIIERSSTNKPVYLWFIELHKDLFYDLNHRFNMNKKNLSDVYKEKERLEWFTIEEIKNNKDILYHFKQIFNKISNDDNMINK